MAGGSLHVTLRGPDGEERDLTFSGDVLRVGRARDCDLPLDSGYVSRYHARLERTDDGWTVADEGSKNGIYVNGQRVNGTWSIEAGDTVRVGDYTLVVDPQKFDYERTLAIPFVARSPRGRAAGEAGPLTPDAGERPLTPNTGGTSGEAAGSEAAAAPKTAGTADAAAPPGPEPPAAPSPPPARVVVNATARQVVVDGRTVDLAGTLAGRGLPLITALSAAPDGRDSDELVAAVWGAGRADVDMLDRLVYRLQRQFEPDAPRSTLLLPRDEGGYVLVTT